MAEEQEKAQVTLETIEAVAKADFLAWWETYTKILTKDAKLVSPRANYLQKHVAQVIRWLKKNQKPIRLVVLKPRQMGSSTITAAVITHFIRSTENATACVLGDELDTSQNLLNMVNRYVENDNLDWGQTFSVSRGELSNGSRIAKETANDPGAGRSMTLQALLCSEVAHYRRAGERSGEKILLAIRNCVPTSPNTIVIEESTPNGAGGAFYNTWQSAVTFDEYKSGKTGNGYIRIFAAWHNFEENQEKETEPLELSFKEQSLRDEFSLTDRQLAWRRRVIKEKCGGDVKQFEQEYPSDPISCFLASGRPRFDLSGISALEKTIREPIYGTIDVPTNFTKPIFRSCSVAESWAWIWENPKENGRYLISADCMTGNSQVSGSDPDSHSVVVLRAGYFDADGSWIRPALVARVRPPCRVDIDVLAEFIERLSLFYGGCLVVPEVNGPGLALIELLKESSINLYQREIFNLRESKRSKALGWQTTDKTRRIVIEELASAIRDHDEKGSGIDIYCRHAIEELKTFVITESGRSEAAAGRHDDDVLAIAIGITTIAGATRFNTPAAVRTLPKDLQPIYMSRTPVASYS